MKRYKSNKIVKILRVVFVFIILVFIFYIPQIIKKTIKINYVECTSQYEFCPDEILSEISSELPLSLEASKSKLEDKLGSNLLIESYLIQYQIPDKLKIEIILKKPIWAISDVDKKKILLIDDKGVVLHEASDTNLIMVVKDNVTNYKIGENISEIDLLALQILQKVNFLYSINEGRLLVNEFDITLSDGYLVRFPVSGEVDSLVGALRLIYSRLNDSHLSSRIGNIKEIDLRFKNPILR